MHEKISIREEAKLMKKVDKSYPLEVEIPTNIMVELTNICNLRCKMCYNKYMKRKKGFMSYELFKKIVDQAKELNIENLGLYTTGESFLHPQLFDFIKYAKEKGIKYVYITTNGQAIEEDKILKIFESGLDSIKFSIDAGNKEKYEYLKVGASWEKLLDTIKKIRDLRDSKNSKLKIFASFIITEDNFKDLLEYKKNFDSLIDETNFTIIQNQGSQMDIAEQYPKKIFSNIQNYILPKERWHPCNLLWNRFIITYEGYLTICCTDFENKLIYGNLNKNSLRECWNNEKIKEFREIHKSSKFEKLPMCFNCDKIKNNTEIDINKILQEAIQ